MSACLHETGLHISLQEAMLMCGCINTDTHGFPVVMVATNNKLPKIIMAAMFSCIIFTMFSL